MSEHALTVEWKRATADFVYETYSRNHEWVVPGGDRLPASSAPVYKGDADRIDPEQGFVASISSCHMLWFLHLACDRKFTVDSYRDDAVGHLEKDAAGQLAITRVILKPAVVFSGDRLPSRADLEALHHEAHAKCFIAHSVKSAVTVEPIL